jgi:acetolactate synthase-1/3 small subunit
VVRIADMTKDAHIERELLLMKVKVRKGDENQLSDLIKTAGARVMDDGPETYTLERTGANDHMDEFIDRVAVHAEILAVVRSGAMAIARGEKELTSG